MSEVLLGQLRSFTYMLSVTAAELQPWSCKRDHVARKAGVLLSTGSQGVGHDLAAQQQKPAQITRGRGLKENEQNSAIHGMTLRMPIMCS